MKPNGCNLYFLSTLACQLKACLTEQEQKLLATNLKALGELLEVTLVQQELLREEA